MKWFREAEQGGYGVYPRGHCSPHAAATDRLMRLCADGADAGQMRNQKLRQEDRPVPNCEPGSWNSQKSSSSQREVVQCPPARLSLSRISEYYSSSP